MNGIHGGGGYEPVVTLCWECREPWAGIGTLCDRCVAKLRAGPTGYMPINEPSLTEDRRLTALNVAAKWSDHGCNRVDLENATLRIERYLRTGKFDAEP